MHCSKGPDNPTCSLEQIHLPNGALNGLKVLDLTHHIAGPYCTKLLGDFAADIIKIERPTTGDPSRSIGPFFEDDPHPEKSLTNLYLNTSKRSVTLDITSEAGKRILRQLIAATDVLVENFSLKVMTSLGLDYDSLKKINPQLVMASISNFGQTGPYRDYKATDIVECALAGLMYIFGENSREPLKHAMNQAQFKAGTNAAGAVSLAVFHRKMTGTGQHIDVSIQESMAVAMRDTTSMYTYMGAVRRRQPEASGEVPRAPLEAKDGFVVPIFMGRAEWSHIIEFLDDPRLKVEKFATSEGRVANADELQEVVLDLFRSRSKEDFFEAAHANRYPFGVVNSPAEIFSSPQFVDREYFQQIDHPFTGPVTYPGAPLKMSRTLWKAHSPAPTLGQHTSEVLGSLGYSDEDLTRLRDSGVI